MEDSMNALRFNATRHVRAAAFLACAFFAKWARADEPQCDRHEAQVDPCDRGDGDHWELSLGFMGGQMTYGTTPFAFDSGSASSLPGATQLVTPFTGAPYSAMWQVGPRVESRLVMKHVRVSVGYQWALPRYSLAEATTTASVGGVNRLITVQSLQSGDLRFGLGAETSWGPVTPFVDLVGTMHFISTDLVIDGSTARYTATTFSYAVQAGLRIYLHDSFYVVAAGEYGWLGEDLWSATVGVGWLMKL
jgi:hypothetical protein